MFTTKNRAEVAGLAIETSGLTKLYGRRWALRGIDLRVRKGEIFGFLGPNGAGKTTTIRILLDFIRPTAGTARVLGFDAQRQSLAVRSRVTYLPGEVSLYENLTAAEFLSYAARLRRDGSASDLRRDELASRLDIDLSRRIGRMSRGMKQKVAIIQVLMHDAELIILDEPTSGLDPLVQHEFYEILREERDKGRTIFMSSHYLAEVERVCDRVGIIRAGELVVTEDIMSLKQKRTKLVEVSFAGPVSQAELRVPGVSEVSLFSGRPTETRARISVRGDVRPLLHALSALPVQDLSVQDASLEDIFLEYYQAPDSHPGAGAAAAPGAPGGSLPVAEKEVGGR